MCEKNEFGIGDAPRDVFEIVLDNGATMASFGVEAGQTRSINLGGVSIVLSGLMAGSGIGYEGDEFHDERVQKDFREIVESTTEYVANNDIGAIALLDRAARPLGWGLKQYWKTLSGDDAITQPDIYFVDPHGFRAKGFPRRKGKVDARIAKELPGLHSHKHDNVLVMDTCIHYGRAMVPVAGSLIKAGFSGIHLGVASEDFNLTGLTPDLIALDRKPLMECTPFGRTRYSTLVERGAGRLVTARVNDPFIRAAGYNSRHHIKQIVTQ